MKYYFPIHLNGDNRGCEAIAKGTALIINDDKKNLYGLCTNIDLDKRLGIDDYVTLIADKKETFSFRLQRKFINLFFHNKLKTRDFTYKYHYDSFLHGANQNDIMISTGGDMMCYGDNQVNYTTELVSKRGIKSILWGCSIGEKNLTPAKIKALKEFSLIYARETLTKEVLVKHNIKNVVVHPDPAFILKAEKYDLPDCFNNGEVIGINLSNFTMGGFTLDSPFAHEVKSLVDYILKNTKLQILLIPHVLWDGQDDRIVSNLLCEYFASSRISVLATEKMNYCQIRYVISKCQFFIGARTHAVISAYSMKVPALAIGYSIKSKGIAKDLGLPENMVVDSINIKKGALLDSFCYLYDNNIQLREHLNKIMDPYIAQVWDVRKDLAQLINTK